MACLSKIQSAITYDCDGGNVGLISALLINKEDIASFAFSPTNASLVTDIKLKEGALAYKIDTVKRTLVTAESLKINEGAPNAYTHTATVVVTAPAASVGVGQTSILFRDIINPFANGSFVILTRGSAPVSQTDSLYVIRAFGLYYGMSATAVDRSSHDNGAWYTITMATPERVIGEEALRVGSSVYDTLYSAAVG